MPLFKRNNDYVLPKLPRTPLQKLIARRNYDTVLRKYVQNPDMNKLQDTAYRSKRGFAIGTVNNTDRVLFVSGSRNLTDWVFNAADDMLPSKLQFVSNRTAANLTALAKKFKADVVVGHSRGGALVAKMNLPNFMKLGLDAAIRLAPKDRRDMMNLYQDQLLDKFIAKRGTNSKKYKLNSLGDYHFLSRSNNSGEAGQYTYRGTRP
jgi:hypothetical protein